MPDKLSLSQITESLQDLNDWTHQKDCNSLYKKFKFKDFKCAFSFMEQVAEFAEKINHHPDWKNCYNNVEVTLSTHDINGISELDIKMATEMNRLYD